ncbi:MAG: DEAD/DEAH box helicase [Candidatus Uhrbacteria bacterium]|nr:DEAD/DEAH box helicase [Candidatus Uhrbacteria bacterium]
MTETEKKPSFDGLGIFPDLLTHLSKLGFHNPTPIQEKAIPIGVTGEDLIGIAQTGTGKTLAFSIPMMQQISVNKGQGLILLPTRELALQVEETLQKLSKPFGLRTAVLIGGAAMSLQIKALRNKPHVIVATPGRLLDHMEQKILGLQNVKVLVLDEADRMLDMGFEPQIKKILAAVPKERQTMLFSATMPEKISQIAEKYMKKPLRIEMARQGTANANVEQEFFMVGKGDKLRLLDKILSDYKGSVLVFSRTKHGAKKITTVIEKMGHTVSEIHSNKSLNQRKMALAGFKSGRTRVLVATDIASRGIDVTNIELVINFDLPDQAEDYVHRIGRTGRAGRTGKAISFATPDQKRDLQIIERLIRTKINVSPLPELPAHRAAPVYEPERDDRRGGRGSYQKGGRSGGYGSGGGSRSASPAGRQGGSYGTSRGGNSYGKSKDSSYGGKPKEKVFQYKDIKKDGASSSSPSTTSSQSRTASKPFDRKRQGGGQGYQGHNPRPMNHG